MAEQIIDTGGHAWAYHGVGLGGLMHYASNDLRVPPPAGLSLLYRLRLFRRGAEVSQITFGGLSWRQAPQTARQMFDVFPVMRQLHELLWYLTEALALPPARSIHGDLDRARNDIERLTRDSAETLANLDVAALRHDVNALLLRASELVRADVPGRKEPPGR